MISGLCDAVANSGIQGKALCQVPETSCDLLKARHWFLRVRCPACRTTRAVDLRALDRHPWSAISSLIPALSCRSCRPHAPFAELVRLSDKSVADELHEQHTRRALGD